MMKSIIMIAVIALAASAYAKVYFEETFDDESWTERWTLATEFKPEAEMGTWKHSSGKWYGDKADQAGIMTSEDARFYSLSALFEEEFDNTDSDLVFQFTVKHEQKIDCGGGYFKLLPSGFTAADQAGFGGDSEYAIMFGPDICGPGTRRTHAILNYESENHLLAKEVKCEFDEYTHAYTFILHADNTYDILIDGEEKQTGSLADDWDLLLPQEIKDPAQSKPADWVDEAMIDDPEDVKPEGWDAIPETIVDPDAEKPEDWDEELDGEWEAPLVDNPEYKGVWRPRRIANPDYEGPWVHPMIPNPDFVADDTLYQYKIAGIGGEFWQVKSGTIFDNILVTDSVEEAAAHRAAHFDAHVEAEKENHEAVKESKRLEDEAARAAAEAYEAEQAALDADEEEEEEEDIEEDVEEEHEDL